MVYYFTPEKSALNFGPRHHARWSSRQFLLWPALAYRVVAPRVRKRTLNMLQRAILGLCRAGVYRVEAIAEHLSVHPDLAGFIITELRDLGYLNTDGLPTEQGLCVLAEDAVETQEMVAGYVFQDPWNGDLWPRFVEKLDYCELEFKDTGFPSLVMGTTGEPRRYRIFTVLPRDEVNPSMPKSLAVVQAVARHRRGLSDKDVDDSDEENVGHIVVSSVHIRRVSLVEKPRPVFLLTYLYVPESDGTDWYACDPFGLGQSPRLRRRVEAVMHEAPGLYDVVNRLVGKTLYASHDEQKRWIESIQLQAGLEVDRRLGVSFRNHRAFDQVLEMEASRQEVHLLGSTCPKRKVDEVLRAGSKVLEVAFASLAAAHPLDDIWKRVYVQRVDPHTGKKRVVPQAEHTTYSATYEGAFHSLGFSPIPTAFLNVKPGQIRSVADYGDHWRLRPLVTATALLAQRDGAHPFAAAAKISPQLLDTINNIATTGARAGHANDESVSLDEAEQHVANVYSVVSMLLGLRGQS